MTSPPPISQRMREQAKQLAGQWLYAIDPLVDPDGPVPPAAIQGAWPVDDDGRIKEEEWRPNPRFQPQEPSERDVVSAIEALGEGRPTDLALRVIGRAQVTIIELDEQRLAVVEGARGSVIEAWVRDDDARTSNPGMTVRRTRVGHLAESLSGSAGIEFVLPGGRRVGLAAEGVAHLVGSPSG